jgi:hypothetical protein
LLLLIIVFLILPLVSFIRKEREKIL